LDKTKLNNLAFEASIGCIRSRDLLYEHFIPLIRKESREIWYKVFDETSFEWECYETIRKAINSFSCNIKSFQNLVTSRIYEIKSVHLKRRRRDYEQFTPVEAMTNNDDEEFTFDIKDVLANVEDEVLQNEKVALLAEGDSRKLAILKAWSNERTYNDSDLAKSLAEQLGGSSESHRIYIQRFRIKCQESLAETA
jgi:hypothetical protein